MLTKAEVIVDHDELSRIVYIFCFIDGLVYLDSSMFQARETTRHKFRTDTSKSYSRLYERSHGIKEEPDIDIDIQYEAVRQIRSQIKFRKWRDR